MTAGLKSSKSSHKIQTWSFHGKSTQRNIYMLFRDYKSTNTLTKANFYKTILYIIIIMLFLIIVQLNYLQGSRYHINFILCTPDYFNQTTVKYNNLVLFSLCQTTF